MTVRQHRLSDPPYPSDYIYPADKDYPLNEDWEGGPIALLDTSEGLNYQAWHLTYLADAPVLYNPDMQLYDGTTSSYSKTGITTAGNKVTAVIRFNNSGFTGDTAQRLMTCHTTSGARIGIIMWSSDHSTFPNRQSKLQMFVQNDASALVCLLLSIDDVDDGLDKIAFCEYDGDAGTAVFVINGVDAIDVSNPDYVAPIVGTLDTASSAFYVGSDQAGTSLYDGKIGYVGYRDIGGLDPLNFMDGNKPKQLDEVTWIEWGGVPGPAFWKDTGAMDASIGTDGVMTKNGTITQVPADPIPGVFQGFQVTPEDTGDPISVLSGVNSVQCGLAFDQNAHVTIVWVDQFDVGHLYWYDTTVGNWIITDFANPVAGVGLTLDDKRNEQTGASDILLWYTLAVDGHHEIYTREQRDRFATPYPMEPGLAVWPYFKKLGMADELRVQMTMTNVGPV